MVTPVSVVQLLEWTGRFWERQDWDAGALDPMAVKDVLTAWRECLNEEPRGGETRYGLYHASFQDFLAEEVGLVTYHETIGETELAKIPGFVHDA